MSYSWLIDRVVDRLRPDEEELRERFRVSEEINILALDNLRDENEVMWRRATEVLSEVVDDIVERRLPRDLDEVQREFLCAEYSELQQMIRQHRVASSSP